MTGAWAWRGMRVEDLDCVVPLADALFPEHPEDVARFAERLALGGDLCLTLAKADGRIGGYAVAYPCALDTVPPLNRASEAPRGRVDAIYLNDLGVHPDLAGHGHAGAGLAMLVERARRAGYRAIALVAVNESARFWQARGFAVRAIGSAKLAVYGPGACYMVLSL